MVGTWVLQRYCMGVTEVLHCCNVGIIEELRDCHRGVTGLLQIFLSGFTAVLHGSQRGSVVLKWC